MFLPAQSIYGGTWAYGPPPDELVDFELMRQMRWSWGQLQATPLYVRRYSWDFLNLRAEAEADANEQSRREIERARRENEDGYRA